MKAITRLQISDCRLQIAIDRLQIANPEMKNLKSEI